MATAHMRAQVIENAADDPAMAVPLSGMRSERSWMARAVSTCRPGS